MKMAPLPPRALDLGQYGGSQPLSRVRSAQAHGEIRLPAPSPRKESNARQRAGARRTNCTVTTKTIQRTYFAARKRISLCMAVNSIGNNDSPSGTECHPPPVLADNYANSSACLECGGSERKCLFWSMLGIIPETR